MWIRICFIGLMILLSMVLVSCSTASDQMEDDRTNHTNEEGSDETEEDNHTEPDEPDEKTDEGTEIELQIGSTETVTRKVEGMDDEVEVTHYKIEPYQIAYQLDEELGTPEVAHNEIIYTTQQGEYQITLEVLANVELDSVVSDVQERMEADTFEEQGELEKTPADENVLNGKMQFFGYPVEGFYVYEIDEHVLVITYQYPEEAGDGMEPLLEALRKSIEVQ